MTTAELPPSASPIRSRNSVRFGRPERSSYSARYSISSICRRTRRMTRRKIGTSATKRAMSTASKIPTTGRKVAFAAAATGS